MTDFIANNNLLAVGSFTAVELVKKMAAQYEKKYGGGRGDLSSRETSPMDIRPRTRKEFDSRGLPPGPTDLYSVYAKHFMCIQMLAKTKVAEQGGYIFLRKPLLQNPGPVVTDAEFVITPLFNEYGELPLHIRHIKPKNIPVPKKRTPEPEKELQSVVQPALSNKDVEQWEQAPFEQDHEMEAPRSQKEQEMQDVLMEEVLLLPNMREENSIEMMSECTKPTTSMPSYTEFEDEVFDSNIIRCVCNIAVENDEMVQCDQCHVWQHSMCVDITEKQQAGTAYYCEKCMPRSMPKVPLNVHEEMWSGLRDMIQQDVKNRSLYAIERIGRLQKFQSDYEFEDAMQDYFSSIRSSR